MTNKRKVYNELTLRPKRVTTIAKATGLTTERTLAFLKQLHKEGRADYRSRKTGSGWIRGTGVPPKPVPPSGGGGAGPPVAPSPPKPAPSWTLPSPLVMSGVHGDNEHSLNPATGQPRAGVGTIGNIIVPGVCPLWECRPVTGGGRGLLGQIEGYDQLQMAIDLINAHKQPGDHIAIVGTGNVPAQRMLEIGCTVAFYELNAQAAFEPYGNWSKIEFQGHQDGWPHCYPSYGVYVPVSLEEYANYHPQVTSDGGQTWTTSPRPQGIAPYYAIFSGQGMQDTDSWAYFATL